MKVELLFASPLWLASNAIRMSHDNHHLSDSEVKMNSNIDGKNVVYPVIGKKDKELIYKVGNKFKHKSVIEQLVYWFEIDGISRACLQELARHRTARLTVKSTRYTLKELKNESFVVNWQENTFSDNIEKYLVLTGDWDIDKYSISSLIVLQKNIKSGKSNDITKYIVPEAFKTKLQWQIDGRNLQNFLELRTSKDALWEIRELAYKIFNELPNEHKYLYEDYINKEVSDV